MTFFTWFLLPLYLLFILPVYSSNLTFPLPIEDNLSPKDPFPPVSLPYTNLTNLTLSTAPLEKRQTISLTLNTCPEGLRFKRSQCHRSISPAAYSITCVYYGWDGTPRGAFSPVQRCPPDYFCIDGVRRLSEAKPTRRVRTAYCVHTQNFVRLSQRTLGQGSFAVSSAYHPSKKKGRVGAVEAVVTDDNGAAGECVNAMSLSIAAQTSDQLGGSVTSWRELVGGKAECSGCASVGLEEMPAGTTRVEVKGDLGAGVGGLLFLAGVWGDSSG